MYAIVQKKNLSSTSWPARLSSPPTGGTLWRHYRLRHRWWVEVERPVTSPRARKRCVVRTWSAGTPDDATWRACCHGDAWTWRQFGRWRRGRRGDILTGWNVAWWKCHPRRNLTLKLARRLIDWIRLFLCLVIRYFEGQIL